MQGETWGLNAAELVEALLDHGMRGLLDAVVVHQPSGSRRPGSVTASFAAVTSEMLSSPQAKGNAAVSVRRVVFNPTLAQRIEDQGPLLIVRDLVDPIRPTWHDVPVLSEVLEGVLGACPSRRR
jgi:hypothetical protein